MVLATSPISYGDVARDSLDLDSVDIERFSGLVALLVYILEETVGSLLLEMDGTVELAADLELTNLFLLDFNLSNFSV